MGAQGTTQQPEYLLRVFPVYADTEQEYRTVVLLQTVREFASFRYELGTEETKSDHGIRFRVTGLKAPQLSLPGNGPAFMRREYQGLNGDLTITIEGLDGKTNTFEFAVSERSVTLINAPADPFVNVHTTEEIEP